MKNIFAILSLLVLALLSPANAFELEVRGTQMVYNDKETKAGPGIELKTKIDDLYGYLSERRVWVYGDFIRINAVGIGFNYPNSRQFHFWGHIGYYIPDYDENQFAAEPLWFYQNKYLHGAYCPTRWPRYTANWDPNFGGEMGVDYKWQIHRRVSAGLSLSYHFLSFNEMITSYQESGEVAWYVEQNRDFGGFKGGLIIGIEF